MAFKAKYCPLFLFETKEERKEEVEQVISVLNSLPKEFELEKYIDYDTQFEKAFVEPLKGVLDVIGWDTERRSSLDNFFI